MSNTVINAKIIDQKVQLTNIPLIASGSQGVLQIKCAFDDLWAGYQTTAVFFREEKGKVTDVFHVPVYQGLAEVPHEVLKAGVFFLSFMGVAENTRTTVAVPLEVKRGAITEGTSVPDPTPDVYTQLLEILNQTSIIPDATLTQAGKAADAKATGDAIVKAKEDLMQDVADMVGDAASYIKDSFADSVIERGIEYQTNVAWTWEKWKSGKAVCWGRYTIGEVNINIRWGLAEDTYPWRESAAYTADFPVNFFVEAPDFLDLTVMNSSGAALVNRYVEDLTKTNTGKFTLSRPTSMTVNNVVIGFYAIGRWKAEDESTEASSDALTS